MDIVFQFGKYEITQTASNSVGVLAFLSPLVAVLLFFGKYLFDSIKEKREKNKKEKDSLLYFESLFVEIIIGAEKQAEAYKKHYENIESTPTEFHPLVFYIIGDLNRILDKFNHQEIFNAFLKKSNKASIDTVPAFMSIFSVLDYLKRFFEEALNSHIKYRNDLISDKTEFVNSLINNIYFALVGFHDNIIHLKQKNGGLHPEVQIVLEGIQNVLQKFEDETNNSNIKYLNDEFLIPLREIVLNIDLPDIEKLKIDCVTTFWKYNQIIGQSLEVSQEFKRYYQELETKIADIKIKDYFKLVR